MSARLKLRAVVVALSLVAASVPTSAENKLAIAVQKGDVAQPAPSLATPPAPTAAAEPDMTMSDFLDRLMIAESGGDDTAKNSRSTAVGPYQFIEGTWLDLMRRHFVTEIANLNPQQILTLRTSRAIARRAAEIYSKENAAVLTQHGAKPTFTHLRLAFLLGPMGAVRVIKAEPETRVAILMGPAVARANPFMHGLTTSGLIARAARDLKVRASSIAALAASEIPAGVTAPKSTKPRIAVKCNLALASCRRWLTLAQARAPSGKKAAKRASLN
ncbi:MAG: hypothetical protein ABL898_11220 [Hyphomicrobiaceae bacterium]